ncbi:MAG: OsmC family peroxiredoxin, partial [Clostridiales bacterium]|nr:OsmC family peroxiredoxin [Clostridiales bacterium]
MADTIFQAKAELTSGLTTRCDARDFTIILDEPADI